MLRHDTSVNHIPNPTENQYYAKLGKQFIQQYLSPQKMTSKPQSTDLLELEQLQREFDLPEFTTVVGELLSVLQLGLGVDLQELYIRIRGKSGKVIGKDILRVLHLLKEEAQLQKQLDNEIKFYMDSIEGLIRNGKNHMTVSQFFVHFVLNNTFKGMVTEQIQDKVAQYKMISMQKLLGLIENIEKCRQGTRLSRLYPLVQKQEEEETMDITMMEMGDLDQLRTILIDNCMDQGINSKAVGILEKIRKKLLDDADEIYKLEDHNRNYENRQAKFNEQLLKMQQIIQEKEYIINKMHQQNEKYQEEIIKFEQKCREDFTEAIQKLSQDNQRLQGQQQKMTQLCEQLSLELEWYRNNYMGIREQYSKAVRETEIQSARVLAQQNQKQNIQRIKQEMNQMMEKVKKLRKQNLDLKNKVSDLEIELEARAMTSGHQTDRTFVNLALDQRIPGHYPQEAKETFLQLLRKKTPIENIDPQLNKSISQHRNNSIRLIRTATKQYFDTQLKTQNSVFEFEDEQENPQLSSSHKYRINEYDYAGVLSSPILQPLTSLVTNPNQLTTPSKLIFSSIVHILQPNGHKQRMTLLLSSDRLLLCKEQLAVRHAVRIDRVRELCFCEGMRNWMVAVLDGREGMPYQFVMQVYQRVELLDYLLKTGFQGEQQNRLRISFKKEEEIDIRQNGQLMALSSFIQMQDFVGNSINDGQNVFEAKMHEYYVFLSRTVKVLLVVNSIGILIFQGGKDESNNLFQYRNKLKILLPFCDFMEVIDLSQQKRLKIVYPNGKGSHLLQFQSQAQSKLARSRINYQRNRILQAKKQQVSKFVSIFRGFKKMRSVDEQSTLMQN